jgi:predicted nuclease with TOPRIM domain
MTTQTKQDPIRELHECNSDIYDLIDRLNAIEIDNSILGLTFQNFRDATVNIQKAIGTLIDKATTNETQA